MKCPECGLELMIYDVTLDGDGKAQVNYVCRNPQCGRYDRRLTKKPEAEKTAES